LTHLNLQQDGGHTITCGLRILKYTVLVEHQARANVSDNNTNLIVYLRITKANEALIQQD
ncbi:hypothetical protein, partial [Acinetobacter baylyi]|uniref:hypothetical protein n=1 Tax=Acinetobacter baylyi TaxID=202950 RepID=UPI001C0937B3